MSFCCLTRSTNPFMRWTSLLDRSFNKFIPGLFSVAAQLVGTPHVSEPKEKKMILPLPLTSNNSGDSASSRFLPAPELFMPASLRVSEVSCKPEKPQSKT
jgi:hypothetical protein